MALASHTRSLAASSRFAGCKAPFRSVRPVSRQRSSSVKVQAFIREYPDPQFIEETKAAFPDKMAANVEEARVLFSADGYTYLDVRPPLELEEVGKVKGCVNIPVQYAKRVYDSETRKKKIQKEENKDFIKMIKKRFPNKETKLLVGCSNGKVYSMDALEQLDEEGYTNLVLLKGGYYAWFRVFDNKLGRRRFGEYAENYAAEGGDSCGIHSSGAGFDRVDAIEMWIPPDY